MRAFIAVDLPQEVKNKIEEIQNQLKFLGVSAKWVKPANVHITLKFLGYINEGQIKALKEIISQISLQFNAFRLKLDKVGSFPNLRRPRVLFVKAVPEENLKKISQQLEEELEKEGFKKEGRFKSHITLARFRKPKVMPGLEEKVSKIKMDKELPIDKISLFKSTLRPQGPVYEEIFKSRLTK